MMMRRRMRMRMRFRMVVGDDHLTAHSVHVNVIFSLILSGNPNRSQPRCKASSSFVALPQSKAS